MHYMCRSTHHRPYVSEEEWKKGLAPGFVLLAEARLGVLLEYASAGPSSLSNTTTVVSSRFEDQRRKPIGCGSVEVVWSCNMEDTRWPPMTELAGVFRTPRRPPQGYPNSSAHLTLGRDSSPLFLVL